MLILLSPAKTLDFDSPPITSDFSQPDFLDEAEQLNTSLKKLKSADIAKLMKVSDAIAELNTQRFQNWQRPFNTQNAKQAALSFRGDVYTGLNTDSFSKKNFEYGQKHLRILSGLYGLLRPLDLIQPYRLEMGTKYPNAKGRNLYDFWGDSITEAINQQIRKLKTDTVINLASNEYFKAVKPALLAAKIVAPEFRDYKNGDYKIISFYAKKARGLMTQWIIKNRIEKSADLPGFDLGGYRFNKALSKPDKPVFTRKP